METCHISRTKLLDFRARRKEGDGLGSRTDVGVAHECCPKDQLLGAFLLDRGVEAWVSLRRALNLPIGFFGYKTKELLSAARYLGIPKIQQHLRLY